MPGELERAPVAGVGFHQGRLPRETQLHVSPTVETGKCFILIYKAEQLCIIIP